MSEVANLVIAIDSTSANKAFVDVDKLTDASEKLDKATDDLGKTSERTSNLIGRQNEQMTQKRKVTDDVTDAGQRYIKALQLEFDMLDKTRAQIERANAIAQQFSQSEVNKAAALGAAIEKFQAQERVASEFAKSQDSATRKADEFIASLKRQAETLNMTKQEMLAYQAAQMGVSKEAAPFIDKLGGAEQGMHKMNFATAGARRELLVLAHEASQGQWSRFGGSLMVLGERTDALGLLFSSTGMAIGAAAVAVGAFAVAAVMGAKETSEFNKQLDITGGYAGITKGQFDGMAASIANSAHVGIGSAKEAMQGLVSTGRFTADSFDLVSKTAIDFAHQSGNSTEDVIKDFVKMTDGVTKWASEHNKQYHFLSAAQYEHIAALEKEGKTSEAIKIAMQALDDQMKTQVQNLGLLERAWDATKGAMSSFWDGLKSIGRASTSEDVIASAQKNIQALNNQLRDGDQSRTAQLIRAQIAEQQAVIDNANETKRFAERAALLKSEVTQRQDAGIKAIEASNKWKEAHLSQSETEKKLIKEYEDGQKAIRAAGGLTADTDAERTARLSQIHEEAFGKEKKARIAGMDDRAKILAGQLAADQAQIEEARSQNTALQKLDDLRHQYGDLSDKDYYQNKTERALAYEKIQIDGYNKQLADLAAFNAKTKVEIQDKANKEFEIRRSLSAAERDFANHEKLFAEQALYAERAATEEKLGITDKQIDSLKKLIDTEKQKLDQIGMSKSQVEALASAKYLDSAASDEQTAAVYRSIIGDMGYSAELDKLAAKLEASAALKRGLAQVKEDQSLKQSIIDAGNEALAQAKKAETAWETSNKAIGDGLYNALGRGGETAIKKLIQDAKSWFARLVLNPIIAPISAFGASIINPTAASAQGGSAQSLVSGAGNLYGLANIGTSISAGFAGISQGIGTGLEAIGTKLGSTLIENFGIGMQVGQGGLSASAVSMGLPGASAGSTVASALPYVGIAAAAAAILYKGLSMGDKKITGQTLSGTLGTQDLSRNVNWSQSGGFLRSDRSGTWSYGLSDNTAIADGVKYTDPANAAGDKNLLKLITGTYDSLKSASADYAKTLGIDGAYLATRTQEISGSLGKTADEINKNLTEIFGNVSNDISTELLNIDSNVGGGLKALALDGESASVTLTRLATDLTQVNAVFSMLGVSALDASGKGAAAAESLISAFGSLATMQTASKSYFDNYYSDAEKLALTTKQVSQAFADAGVAMPKTREELRVMADAAMKAGDDKTYAAIIKLSAGFASITQTATAAADAVAAQAVAQASSERAFYVANRQAADAATAAIKAASDAAFKTLSDSVAAGMQTMIRAGDARAAVAAQMSVTRIDPGQYTRQDGSFNAGAYNALAAVNQAKIAKELANAASADAINVQDVTKFFGAAYAGIDWDSIRGSIGGGIAADAGVKMGTLVSQILTPLINVGIDKVVEQQYMPNGAGIAGVGAATRSLDFVSRDGQGADVIAYKQAIDGLTGAMQNSRITADDYASGMKSVNKLMGDAITLVTGSLAEREALQRERVAAATANLEHSGLDSIAYYFSQIGKSVSDMATAAVAAVTPLAQVNASIGRLTSLSDVMRISADAALVSGGKDFTAGQSTSVQNAQIVAAAAAKAAASITTADAAAAAKALANKSSFSNVDATQLRDISMLLDGLKQFDSNSFEASFLRMNDALNKGVVTAAQYQDLFAQGLNTYNGLDSVTQSLTTSMTALRDAMSGFADSLLINQGKTTLTTNQTLDELMRQYEVAKTSAMTGDSTSINKYESLANSLLNKSMYESEASYNVAFGKVVGDAQSLESFATNTIASTNGQNVVDELKRNNDALLSRVDELENMLMTGLAQIARNTAKTSAGIDQINIAGIPTS
ncbi:phage tail length tape measure family protein [Undibacterium sp. SXout7W]|uniref:phage tail length tape measure family protein n=1 Tax=Undibacterium sp. SXout7W TaxID=3413049 RepID=UPI003BF33889